MGYLEDQLPDRIFGTIYNFFWEIVRTDVNMPPGQVSRYEEIVIPPVGRYLDRIIGVPIESVLEQITQTELMSALGTYAHIGVSSEIQDTHKFFSSMLKGVTDKVLDFIRGEGEEEPRVGVEYLFVTRSDDTVEIDGVDKVIELRFKYMQLSYPGVIVQTPYEEKAISSDEDKGDQK